MTPPDFKGNLLTWCASPLWMPLLIAMIFALTAASLLVLFGQFVVSLKLKTS